MQKIIRLSLCIILCFSIQAFAQKQGQERVDSLLTQLQKAKEDTNKVNLLVDLSFTYSYINPDEGLTRGEQAYTLAEKLGWEKGMAYANMRKGNNYLSKGDLAKALEYYGKAQPIFEELKDKAALSKLFLNMANTYASQLDNANAAEYYKKANELRPELVSAKLDLGYTCGYMKDFTEAEEWFKLSLSADDESMNFDTYWGYAWLYEQVNISQPSEENRDKAIRYYEQCMHLRSELSDIVYNSIGLLYNNSGDYKKAIEFYIRAMELNPREQVYIDNYTSTLAKTVDISPAYINTVNDNILNETGNFFYRKSEFLKAKECYIRALSQKQEAVYFENLGLANERLSLPAEAEAAYEKSISLDTKTGNSLNRMGVFYYNQGQDEKAIEFYKKALEREPANDIYLQNLAYAYESGLQYEAAKKVYNELLQADSTNDNAWYRLALIAVYDGNNEEALSAITEALKIRPDNIAYLKTAGTIYENLNNYEEALKIYNKALSLNDSDEYFNNRAGIMYYRMGTEESLKRSIEFYNKAIKANDAEAAATKAANDVLAVYWQNLGLAYADLNDLDAAEKAYLHSLEVDKTNAENYNNIGSFYFNKKGDWSKAMKMYEQALKLVPDDSLYIRNLAASYDQLGDYKNADELYAKASELDKKVQAQP